MIRLNEMTGIAPLDGIWRTAYGAWECDWRLMLLPIRHTPCAMRLIPAAFSGRIA